MKRAYISTLFSHHDENVSFAISHNLNENNDDMYSVHFNIHKSNAFKNDITFDSIDIKSVFTYIKYILDILIIEGNGTLNCVRRFNSYAEFMGNYIRNNV
jgi:hypothetical protein